jgi:acyl carrier protein phosphodiesterase
MNFLAHAVLSFQQPELIVGNMISDFVKGKKKFAYTGGIFAGIELHRKIDGFTDEHPVTAEAKEIFRPAYRLYSGPIMDVIYDHFLANDASVFPDGRLETFAQETYDTIERFAALVPPHFNQVFHYMRTQNWLYGYRTEAGMERSLRGLVRRSAFLTESETAFRIFREHYDRLGSLYHSFFPQVQAFAKQNAAPFV